MTKVGHLGQWAKKHKWLSALAILLVFTGVFLLYRQYEIRQEKQRFEQARASIDTLYQEIVNDIGEPNNYRFNESCGRPNVKNASGPLSCSVGVNFVYAVQETEQASDLANKIAKSIFNTKLVSLQSNTNQVTFAPPVTIIDLRDQKSRLDCVLKFAFDAPFDIFLELKDTSDKQTPFFTSISCGTEARAEYFAPP